MHFYNVECCNKLKIEALTNKSTALLKPLFIFAVWFLDHGPNYQGKLVYYEGYLEKYRPGISLIYINRWCQITNTHFSYYKSNWDANCWISKPLMSIPLQYIESVKRVNVEIPINKKLEKKEKELYQFEIYLKKGINAKLIVKNLLSHNCTTKFDDSVLKEDDKNELLNSTDKVQIGRAHV